MYLPAHFDETRVPVLHQLICEYPLAALITLGSDGLNANHVPLELTQEQGEFGLLQGHVARANPMWRDFSAAVGALAIFQGPQTYVSPSWYPSKAEHGKVVPTWNYAVVHAAGPLRIIEDRDWLRALVHRLTNRQEAGNAKPWRVGDAPEDYIEKLLGAIVGIEVPIAKLTGKWKVSQNRDAADRQGVRAALERIGGDREREMAVLVSPVGD